MESENPLSMGHVTLYNAYAKDFSSATTHKCTCINIFYMVQYCIFKFIAWL